MTEADNERLIKMLGRNIIELEQRINDLEVKISNLQMQYNNHDHPYKPEPRYY